MNFNETFSNKFDKPLLFGISTLLWGRGSYLQVSEKTAAYKKEN